MLEVIRAHPAEIKALCRANLVQRLEVFGSTARNDFTDASDVDFLVTFFESPPVTRAEAYFNLWFGSEDLLERRVDLVVRDAVQNPYFLLEATRSAVVVFEVSRAVIEQGSISLSTGRVGLEDR